MIYMLDTNTCIYIIKKHPEKALKRFKTLDIGDICISSITFAELLFGVHKSQHQQKNKTALEEFTAPLEIVPFNEDAANHYGRIRAYLEKKGMPIGSLDTMIAAHARCMDLILVTNNKKEFSRVPHLNIEDWIH
ncbi:MAG TPA: type II toxin-antitoxin system VapC family toxin [Gammaproteobacteria bacterium]|nr:type II toxin-antitoxin system VapC family toxin [Gammaproteobacteria bacterium]